MNERDGSSSSLSMPADLSVPADARPEPAAGERLHALDAVRGFALLLGIVFHSTMSFFNGPQQMWFIVDKSPSTTLTLLFYVLHIFRMTMFFFIAGFFAHLLYHRRGERAFIRDRLRRIGLPLVAGWPVLLALIVGCFIWGARVMHGGVLPDAPPPPPDADAPPLAFPLTHLWFLYVLMWFYTLTLLVRRVVENFDPNGTGRARLDRLVGGIVRSPFGVVLLAIPSCATLMALGRWQPWLGIPTPDGSLLPNVAAFTTFGGAFAFGWLVHRQPQLLRIYEARWPLHLAIALLATAGCIAHIGTESTPEVAKHDLATWGYAAGYALAVWSWSFAIVGLALRYLAGYSAARRYVADASYWLYLIHVPIVFALQIVVSQLPWPGVLKFVLILGISFPLMFASYHYFVRSTLIGGVLNGRRYPRRLSASNESAPNARVEGAV